MRPNILVLSYLFPNRAQPAYGVFVLNRLKAVGQFCNIKVIAPIQWYPLMRLIRGTLWGTRIPLQDEIEGFEVFHPCFTIIPRYMKWLDAITFLWAVRAVVERLRKKNAFDFDLVDVHWTYPDIVAGYFLSRKAGKKFAVTVRGHEALYQEERTLRRWLVAYFLRRADMVVTLSAELRDKVVELGVDRDKARVVLNGVDLTCFHPLDRAACRRQLGLPIEKKILLSVGRLTEGKGHHELVRIMPEISRMEDIELYIIGGVNPEEDFGQVLRTMISELRLNNVHLVDKVAHEILPFWYSAADLFCLATQREGCPNALLEALACGTPVVVTDVGAVGALVVNGENGFLVRLEQVSALAEIVSLSLNWNWNREQIAARMNGWGWSDCAKQVVEIYQSLLEQRDDKV